MVGVEILLSKPSDFLKVKETLTRIGIKSNRDNTKQLFQSCHILHKKGKYYIVHFKEMFVLDGKETTFSSSDCRRRNSIVDLLQSWNLVKVNNPEDCKEKLNNKYLIHVISYEDKKNWELISKYNIGVNGNVRKT